MSVEDITTPSVPETAPVTAPALPNVDITSNGVKIDTNPVAPEVTPTEATPLTQEDVTATFQQQEEAVKTLETLGLDFNKYSEEVISKGELSAESYAELEKAGLSKELVNAYKDGIEAKQTLFVNQVLTHFGGEDSYNQLSAFIRSLGEAQVDYMNKVVSTGNIAQTIEALEGYKARMQLKHGSKNPVVIGGQAVGTGVAQGFSSQAEMIKAMTDPRYRDDTAYRMEVQRKTQTANFLQG